ncbi:SEC22-like protein A, vesicle trafficking protein [Phyllostomus discolor]|uniref:SEC22-like protein A, vesicle trafficking protein n=1 Tax=Phyllostomus discolor TaxID=89673 RepID=A0A834B4Y1_9CHIR|nr:SEC22-like protein A, vesicle trafficking protein [Phyllostomus discolor]
MSMILSASVIRVRDGLPLSASTDNEQGTGVQECRKYFKMLSRKLAQFPDRCTLKSGHYNIKVMVRILITSLHFSLEQQPAFTSVIYLSTTLAGGMSNLF